MSRSTSFIKTFAFSEFLAKHNSQTLIRHGYNQFASVLTVFLSMTLENSKVARDTDVGNTKEEI